MNIWATVKVSLIIFASTVSAMDTSYSEAKDVLGWGAVVLGLLFFPLMVISGLFVLKVLLTKELEFQKPNWQSNPFDFSHPEHFFHLGGLFFVASGIGASLAMYLESGSISPVTLTPLSFGIGILSGIYLLEIVYFKQTASSNRDRDPL